MTEQLQFAFLASLDFPGRTTLTVQEVAAKLGVTRQHVVDLIAEGRLHSLDVRSASSNRSTYRVAIEQYRDFVVRCLTCPPHRTQLFRDLPRTTLLELKNELDALLRAR